MQAFHGRRLAPGAFTLIELLVVFAVIAILIGLLLPALGSARAAARLTVCGVNTRSIGQALTLYADDHRELFPYWSAWQVYRGDGTSNDDTPGLGWCEQVEPYIQTLESFTDPARKIPEAPFAYFLQSRYTALVHGGRLYTSLSHNQVALASQFVLAGDENNMVFYPQPYGFSVKAPECDADDARWPAVFFERDQGREELRPHAAAVNRGGVIGTPSNIVFLDGHAAAFTRYDRSKMTWHGREMRDWSQTR